ncbi:MAG: efflux RND transporter periplasmic adaptor subunit [Parachlamydiaceae bacterium]|nr:efflux RND transporter periplasmic adaptor subunit [Parachlamydiaceae bacterium]
MSELSNILCTLTIAMFSLFAEGPTDSSNIADLQKEIEEATERLRSQIRQSESEIRPKPNQPQAPNEEVHVIIAPYRRTILSNQISTPILSSQVSSTIEKIYKRMGEYFESGELLIKIHDEIFLANLDKAIAAVGRARALLDTRQHLFKDNIISFLDLKEAEASAASAEAEYVLAQTQFEGAFVRAPYTGRVISLAIEEFELPQPGQALIEIEQTDRLLAKILYPSIYYKDLVIGKTITIHVDESDTEVEAQIIRIGGAIDPSSSTIAVDAEIDNRDAGLIPGMTGTTNINSLRLKENNNEKITPPPKPTPEQLNVVPPVGNL